MNQHRNTDNLERYKDGDEKKTHRTGLVPVFLALQIVLIKYEPTSPKAHPPKPTSCPARRKDGEYPISFEVCEFLNFVNPTLLFFSHGYASLLLVSIRFFCPSLLSRGLPCSFLLLKVGYYVG